MVRNSDNKLSAFLPIEHIPAFESTDAITRFWRALLQIFIKCNCDSFSLSGIESVEDLNRIACFVDWQPPLKDCALVRREADTLAAGRKWRDENLTRFSLDPDVVERLTRAEFHDWFVTSETHAADRLYFFAGPQLLVVAEPNELALLFYELTPARLELLRSIDRSATESLDYSRNWTATTLSVGVAHSNGSYPRE